MKKINSKKVFIVLDIIIVIFVLYICFGYLNFTKIKSNKEPFCSGKVVEIKKDNNIKVYKYGLYKIIRNETPKSNVSYSMKIWFAKDE